MEAEKAIKSIKEMMELLRRGGVFMDTFAETGQKLVEKGLFIIEQSLRQQATRENIAADPYIETLGDNLERCKP